MAALAAAAAAAEGGGEEGNRGAASSQTGRKADGAPINGRLSGGRTVRWTGGSDPARKLRPDDNARPDCVSEPKDPRRSFFSGLDCRWMRLSTRSRTKSPCRSRSYSEH